MLGVRFLVLVWVSMPEFVVGTPFACYIWPDNAMSIRAEFVVHLSIRRAQIKMSV